MGVDEVVTRRQRRCGHAEEVGWAPRPVAHPAEKASPLAVRGKRTARAVPFSVPALDVGGRIAVCGPEHAEGSVASWPIKAGVVLHGYRARAFCWITAPGSATFRFADDGPVVGVRHGQTSTNALRELWLRSVLPLVVQARGTEVLHASAVAFGSKVVALCGRSRAGKSTLAASFPRQGYDVVADDALPFVESTGTMHALALPFELRPRAAARVQSSRPHAGPRLPVRDRFHLGAVVILDPAGDGVVLEQMAPAYALGALMPHAYCFTLDDGKERLVRAYASLASQVPVFALRYRQVPEAIDDAIGVLEGLFLRG